MSSSARTVFATACGERLVTFYGHFHDVTGQGNLTKLLEALETVWNPVSGTIEADLLIEQAAVESLVPDEDDDEWEAESAYAQNSAAAVAYVIRSALGGDPREAVRAARQVLEVADYIAQQQMPDLDLNEPSAERKLRSSPIVQEAMRGVDEDIHSAQGVEAGRFALSNVRQSSREGGQRLFGLMRDAK